MFIVATIKDVVSLLCEQQLCNRLSIRAEIKIILYFKFIVMFLRRKSLGGNNTIVPR